MQMEFFKCNVRFWCEIQALDIETKEGLYSARKWWHGSCRPERKTDKNMEGTVRAILSWAIPLIEAATPHFPNIDSTLQQTSLKSTFPLAVTNLKNEVVCFSDTYRWVDNVATTSGTQSHGAWVSTFSIWDTRHTCIASLQFVMSWRAPSSFSLIQLWFSTKASLKVKLLAISVIV